MVFIVSVVGPSGSGKTSLIERVIRELSHKGVSVAAVKFTHHGFDLDRPGKDSYRLKQAGAASVGVVSPGGWAVIADEARIAFDDLLMKLPLSDLVVTEGQVRNFDHTVDRRIHGDGHDGARIRHVTDGTGVIRRFSAWRQPSLGIVSR